MSRRVTPLVILGLVVAQTMVNLQQMRINENTIRTDQNHNFMVEQLQQRVGAIEARTHPQGAAPPPAPHVPLAGPPPEMPKNAWGPDAAAPRFDAAVLFPPPAHQPRRITVLPARDSPRKD